MYTSEFIQVVANTFTSKVNFTMQNMRKTASYRAIQLSSCLRRRQPRFLLQLRSTVCRRSGVARPTLSHLTTCPPCHTLSRPTLSHLTTAFSTTQLTKQQHRNCLETEIDLFLTLIYATYDFLTENLRSPF